MRKKKTNKLIAYKELHGLSWRELASKIGITHVNLYRLATGKIKDIKVSTANKIKRVTGLDPNDYINK